jgi:hypothetical protein
MVSEDRLSDARAGRRRFDVALALAIAAVQIGVTYAAGRHQLDRRSLDFVGVALLGAGPAALVVRRRMPVATLAMAFASTLAYWLIGYVRGPVFLSLLVAFVTAVMAGHRVAAWSSIGASIFMSPTFTRQRVEPSAWAPTTGVAAGVPGAPWRAKARRPPRAAMPAVARPRAPMERITSRRLIRPSR